MKAGGSKHQAVDGVGRVIVAVEVMTPCVCEFGLPTGPGLYLWEQEGHRKLGVARCDAGGACYNQFADLVRPVNGANRI